MYLHDRSDYGSKILLSLFIDIHFINNIIIWHYTVSQSISGHKLYTYKDKVIGN